MTKSKYFKKLSIFELVFHANKYIKGRNLPLDKKRQKKLNKWLVISEENERVFNLVTSDICDSIQLKRFYYYDFISECLFKSLEKKERISVDPIIWLMADRMIGILNSDTISRVGIWAEYSKANRKIFDQFIKLETISPYYKGLKRYFTASAAWKRFQDEEEKQPFNKKHSQLAQGNQSVGPVCQTGTTISGPAGGQSVVPGEQSTMAASGFAEIQPGES